MGIKKENVIVLKNGTRLQAFGREQSPRGVLANDDRPVLAPIEEIAAALADDLPAPKAPARKSRRRRKKKVKNFSAYLRKKWDNV